MKWSGCISVVVAVAWALWSVPSVGLAQIQITGLHRRGDSDNSKEFVTIKNVGEQPQTIKGWTIHAGNTQRLRVKRFLVLQPGRSFRIYNRSGVLIWPETNGEAKVYNRRGRLIDDYGYDYSGNERTIYCTSTTAQLGSTI